MKDKLNELLKKSVGTFGQDPGRTDRGRVFLELSPVAVDELLTEVAERSIATEKVWWGYEVLRIADPDGNELFICLENLL